jgi:hypothetical protein
VSALYRETVAGQGNVRKFAFLGHSSSPKIRAICWLRNEAEVIRDMVKRLTVTSPAGNFPLCLLMINNARDASGRDKTWETQSKCANAYTTQQTQET